VRTLSEAKAAGSAAPLAPPPGRLKGSQLLVLEVVPLEKGSAEDAGELKGDATGSCTPKTRYVRALSQGFGSGLWVAGECRRAEGRRNPPL